MRYKGVIGFLISPVTGRLLTYEQLPPLSKGEVWIGHVYNNKAIPSLKLIDLRIDVNSLQKELDKLGDELGVKLVDISNLPFILKTPSLIAPNAQALDSLGTGLAKIVSGGNFAIAVADTDYITPQYLTQILSNYMSISEFPTLFSAHYTPAIAASLATYTTTVVTPEIASALALYNTTIIVPETAASIAFALAAYTYSTVDPHIQTAIDELSLSASNYSGDIKQSIRTDDHGYWLRWQKGRTLSRTTYSELWTLATANNNALINSGMFGAGDGSTTFTMGDILGRSIGIAGQGTGLTNRTLGSKTGSEAINKVPEHKHDVPHQHSAADNYGGELVGFKYASGGDLVDHGALGGSGPYRIQKSSTQGNIKYSSTGTSAPYTRFTLNNDGNLSYSYVDIMNPTVYFNLFIFCRT